MPARSAHSRRPNRTYGHKAETQTPTDKSIICHAINGFRTVVMLVTDITLLAA